VAADLVTLKVTGSGTADSVEILDGTGGLTTRTDVVLPYTTTLPNDQDLYGLTVHAGTAPSVTCEIDQPGLAPLLKTATGLHAVVSCIER
jgi:hypothetical protein